MYTVENIFEGFTEQGAVNEVIEIICEGGSNCDITDSSTGEVMFSYKNGNVDYIQGNFARTLLSYLGAIE